MLKKLLAGVITAVLSLGVVALVAGPASAHHNTISVKVDCGTGDSYKVTWTIKNSETDKTEVITKSNMPDVVAPNTTSLAFGEARQFVQTVTEPQNLELAITGYWASTNVYSNDSGWLGKDSFPKGCLKVTPEATPVYSVCDGPDHFTSPTYSLKPVTGVTYTVDGAVKGAGGPFPATNGTTVHIEASASNPKYQVVGTTVWDFTFTKPAADCVVEVTPVEPEFKQQVCDGPGSHELATFTITAVTGVLYYVKYDGKAEEPIGAGTHDIDEGVKTVEVIAKGDGVNHYVIKNGPIIFPVFNVDDAPTCLTEVVPVNPEPKVAQCDVDNHPGVVPVSSYTLKFVPHIVYLVSTDNVTFTPVTLTADTTYNVTPGAHIWVKATVDDPAKYQTPAGFAWDKLFTDPGDCKPEVTPLDPGVNHQYCDDTTNPDNPVLVDGTIVLKAVANVTYFIDGNPATVGDANPNKVAPGAHTVTASFDTTKYKLAPGAKTSFPVTINPGKCLPTKGLVQPLVVSNQIGCFNNGSYTLSSSQADPTAIVWTVNGTPVSQNKYSVAGAGTVVITAAAKAPQYGLEPGSQTSWTINFKKPTVCDLETLALTGQSPTGLLIAADLLVVTGLALFAMRAMRRRPETI